MVVIGRKTTTFNLYGSPLCGRISVLLAHKGSSMGLKLNKWQRVGIILSVIAFVGLALQAWVFQARQRDQFYTMQLILCEDTLRTENEQAQNVGKREDRAKREATNQTEYESCKVEAAELLRTSFDSSYKTMPIFLAKVLAIIIFAWLLEWIIVETLRWMRRGSRV